MENDESSALSIIDRSSEIVCGETLWIDEIKDQAMDLDEILLNIDY